MTEQQVIADLGQIVGAAHVVTAPSELLIFGNDWTKRYTPDPLCAVFPASTEQVSALVGYCHKGGIPMVPSGGRTGLAGGAVAIKREVVISLSRMQRVAPVDTVGMTLTCEAGATTEKLQDTAREAGLFFPLDLASKGSSQIGGNISTNAGGLKVIRFGNMRDNVLGLEVVLPDGSILDLMGNLRKDNTGYDLKQLFIAAEGTLGIITRATLKLHPPLKNLSLACFGVKDFQSIIDILQTVNLLALRPTAFEFFASKALSIVLDHNKSLKNPFSTSYPFYVLLECEDMLGDGAVLENLSEKLFEQGAVEDAIRATSSAEFKGLWALRENITESLAAYGHVRKNDISLRLDLLKPFIQELEAVVAESPPDIQLILFGHIGDGNIHINYIAKKAAMEFAVFQTRARAIEEAVFTVLRMFRGSISAEHGIGLTKKEDLTFSKTKEEIDFMRHIRGILDPKGLMNPGKIFD